MINLIVMWLSKNLMDEVVNAMERNQEEEDE